MRDEAIAFLVSCILGLALAPKQGSVPKHGYELFVTLVGKSGTRKYHIHHWVYLVIGVIIGGFARYESPTAYRMTVAVLTGIAASEFLKYTDVLQFSA